VKGDHGRDDLGSSITERVRFCAEIKASLWRVVGDFL